MKKNPWISILAVIVLTVFCAAALGETAEEPDINAIPVSASELIEMMYYPEDAALIGETIEIEGYFGGIYNEGTEDAYCFLVIAEPGSCCAESIRFIPDAACTEFPEPNTIVTLTGTLEKTETDEYSALRIVNATLTWE
ncbi:MAG: hypothetical protein IJ157_09265 [Clostridia bacterium]|nr:hypothetical protein [Clostridia bacterium]